MEDTNNNTVSVGNWMLTLLLMCIPLVNLIMLFVWAFGSSTPASKANWAKASLIWLVIGIVLYGVIFAVVLMGAGAASATH